MASAARDATARLTTRTMPPEDVRGARVTVMGLGRFGGGLGVTRWLAARGASIVVTDLDPAERLAASLAPLEPLVAAGTVRLELGGHREATFTACDLVVVNPAVPRPWSNPFLRAAADAGVPLTTEVRLVVARLRRDRVIGVTGTAGKSTTAALIASRAAAPARACRCVSAATSAAPC